MIGPADRSALELMVGATYHPTDRARNAALIRSARDAAERAEIMRVIADRHAERLTWVTVTQRRWQSKTRRPSRARHADSVSIREQYVRGA